MGNRKEEILIVALHLFARDGYEAVSVSQIAGELDMTKGALYRHYKSKDCIRWWAKLFPLSNACDRVKPNSMSAVS